MVKAIVGANWGDEGKGKITDMLAKTSDIVVRFQGGANAGHTIINEYGRFSLHQLPSGIFNANTQNIIANGVALDIPKLMKEIKSVQENGAGSFHLLISERAHLVMPYHVLFDAYEEERLTSKSFGSTKSGIAPLFSDKYAKMGIRVCDLFDEGLKERISSILEVKNVLLKHLYHKPELDADEIYEQFLSYRDFIRPYAANTFEYLQRAVKEGKTILMEGQLGSMKDPDFGIYPFTTSSSTLAAFSAIGAGVPPYEIGDIITVVKAYSSAVGAGPFVSEIFGEEAQELRKRGGDKGEYGATTGRPRRMGWFDAVATRYGCMVQGTTQVALTILDALGYLKEIPVCVGYEIDGKVTKTFPVNRDLERAKPVYEVLPGWEEDIRGTKRYEDLPENCKAYVAFIEKQIERKITIVSIGPGREEIVYKK